MEGCSYKPRTPKLAGNQQKLGTGKEGSSPGGSQGVGPADTYVRLPAFKSLVEAIQFVALCHRALGN